MENTQKEILYILNNGKGITKIGITEDFTTRLKDINKNLTTDNQFQEVCKIEVISNPAIVEAFLHEFLGMQQRNLVYLKSKGIIEFDHLLNSENSGYTEYFLSDKDTIKQGVILFSILGYIKIKDDDLRNIDKIDDFSFDTLGQKYEGLLIKASKNKTVLSTIGDFIENPNIELHYIIEKIDKKEKINVDFSIKNNQFVLHIDEYTINAKDMLSEKNNDIIQSLLHNHDSLEYKNKNWRHLFSFVTTLISKNINNDITKYKPRASLNREKSKLEFIDFMEEEGNQKLSHFFEKYKKINGDCIFIPVHLFDKSTDFSVALLDDVSLYKEAKNMHTVNKFKKLIAEKDKLNFNSPLMLKNYFDFEHTLYEKFSELHPVNYMCIYDSTSFEDGINIVEYIYQNIYDSPNKLDTLNDIIDVLTFLDENHNNWTHQNCNTLLRKINHNTHLMKMSDNFLRVMCDENMLTIENVKTKAKKI